MRKLALGVLVALLIGPALPAFAEDGVGELLRRSSEASYIAEQAISCATPDGVRDAVIRITQDEGRLRVSSAADEGVEVFVGSGGWALRRDEGVISSAAVQTAEQADAPLYEAEQVGPIVFLDRAAMRYRLSRDDVKRAELVFDLRSGVMVASTTFEADGSAYCTRRFISFDPMATDLSPTEIPDEAETTGHPDLGLPEVVAGFQRLDQYQDADGVRFAYYSDGFFSFAVFLARADVALPGAVTARLGDAVYDRSFTPGQVTYVWETTDGVMALVGDMPLDLQEAVLTELPPPSDPGILRKIWRSLFG